jgi:hypothetical protein
MKRMSTEEFLARAGRPETLYSIYRVSGRPARANFFKMNIKAYYFLEKNFFLDWEIKYELELLFKSQGIWISAIRCIII